MGELQALRAAWTDLPVRACTGPLACLDGASNFGSRAVTDSVRVERIKSLLVAELEPTQLVVRDDSALHEGHAGARGGAGHFTIWICSERFSGLRSLQRHRLVYSSLASLMPEEIHALSIHAASPQESVVGSITNQEET
ncbi:MAG: BolA family protein [Steroidobacteraceae bacterium]